VLVYGLIVPFTVAALAASGWYVATGQTPVDALTGLASAPHIRMAMPPPLGGPTADASQGSLIHPPAGGQAAKPAAVPTAPPAPPATSAPSSSGAPARPEAKSGKGGPPAINLPTLSPTAAAPATSTTAAPPPTVDEPAIPTGGEPLAPPTFAQLPGRDDLKSLPAGPRPEMLRNSANGPLPIVAGGNEAWRVYARPYAADAGMPKVAIVVTGLGLSKEATSAAIAKLPPEVSLSFSPYASGLDDWIKKARANGHEVLLDLPLEPPNFPTDDPGPMAVMAQQPPAEAVDRLEAILGRGNSYVGVAAALRSPVTASDSWSPLLQDLRNRGLLFLGDGLVGVPNTDLPPAASVTLIGDETPFRMAVDARLARLLLAAQRDGWALAYVSARPVTFERLTAWLTALPEKHVALAPASAVVRSAP
jgi:uncharacterized protein